MSNMTNDNRLVQLKQQRELLRGPEFRTSVQARRDILSAIVPLLNFNDFYYSSAVPIADVLGRPGFSSNFYDQAFAQIDSIVNQAINELEQGLTRAPSTQEAVATAEIREKSHPILVALVGAAGLVIVALIPIMASRCQPSSTPSPIVSSATPSPETAKNHALAVEIVSATYRRAFELTFTTRFAVRSEYESVARSIAESHAAVQSRLVNFTDTGDKKAAETLYRMLKELDQLDGLFKAMSPFVGDEIRLDGTGPAELTSLFHRAEEIRKQYLVDITRFADQTNVPLPPVPAQTP